MHDVLIVGIVFAVPISAILSSVWLRAKKLELQSGGDRKLADRVEAMAAENADLRRRIEVLETIVTSDVPIPRARVRVEDAVEDERADAAGQVRGRSARPG